MPTSIKGGNTHLIGLLGGVNECVYAHKWQLNSLWPSPKFGQMRRQILDLAADGGYQASQ